jgi:FkbM family methyltransferase
MIDRILSRLVGPARRAGEPPRPDAPITALDVAWAYRLFLDRAPESDAVVNAKTVVIKELEGGLRIFVDLSDFMLAAPITGGYYEVAESAFVRGSVAPGQIALDVGANVGYFTLLLASIVGPTGRGFAFEPGADAAGLLERSLAENRLGDRVVLRRAAVGERAGSARLVTIREPLNTGGSYLDVAGQGPPPGHTADQVPVVALDDCDFGGPVAFVKIDVQGAEMLALRGAERTLRRDRPVILSEVAPGDLARVSGCTPAAYVAEVESYDYECRLLGPDGVGPRYAPADQPGQVSVVFLPTA